MDDLPYEIILHIATFLESTTLVRLQLVSRRFLQIARDSNLWREQCFQNSSFFETQLRRREFLANVPVDDERFRYFQRVWGEVKPEDLANAPIAPDERKRMLANWDPSYSTEKVDWYSEFIHREAPIAISWLQQPRHRESPGHEHLEVRGVGTYNPPGNNDSSFAVAPLDDGSICLWNLSASTGRKGEISARSASATVSISSQGNQDRSKMINTGVTECVSIDNERGKAYIAVQSYLMEVDLETLQAISQERFPYSISALSEAKGSTPITVGTNLSLHLYDPRAPQQHPASFPEQLDSTAVSISDQRASTWRSILNPEPLPQYAPLFRPGPLSILHLPVSEGKWDGNGDIYVAGRFPSILNYDRRYFPKMRGTIHSGARLSSLISIPYAFTSQDKERMRRNELTIEQVETSKALAGNTLVACGEYNGKGSLELYGLSPDPDHTTLSTDASSGTIARSTVVKNRQTSASSKLLSVSSHGTRLVFSDGSGNLKWVERDGYNEVRRWNIGHGSLEAPRGVFGTLGDSYMDSGSGDVVRKILHTSPRRGTTAVNNDDLLVWTGEKLGLLGFSREPGFTADSFEETNKSLEEVHKEREERIYAQTMQRALEMQADEARFVRGLGLGYGWTGDL